MGSSFHREGAAYLKERFVIFKEEWVGGRARVTIDEERALSRISPRVRVRVSVGIVYRIATGGYSWIWPKNVCCDKGIGGIDAHA